MPYIGNTIRAADDYRLIDDISSGFNGSTTSFALQVAGSAPVPFPKSPQQVLISVNGVIQEPDPTGSSGFNLVGTNIVFSSAPTNGHAFFGIIYATADYLNAGGNFPAGSLGAPSITFIGDENSGLFRKSGGSVGFVSDATEIANFDSNGITISSGNLIIPESIIHNGDSDTKINFPAADTVSVETGGSERLRIASDGAVTFNTSSGDDAFLVKGDSFTAVRIVAARDSASDHAMFQMLGSRGTNASPTIIQSGDALGTLSARGYDGNSYASSSSINFAIDGTPGDGDMPGRITFSTSADGSESPAERMRIDSSGKVGIGTTSPSSILHLESASSPSIKILDTTNNTNLLVYSQNSDAHIGTYSNHPLVFDTNSSEKLRIDTSGNVGIGTSSPSNLLTLTHSANASDGLIVKNTNNSQGSAIAIVSIRGGDNASGRLELECNGQNHNLIEDSVGNLVIEDNGTERMRIDSSGHVGIGTTSTPSVLNIKDTITGVQPIDDTQTITIQTGATSGAANTGTGIMFLNHNGSSGSGGGTFGGTISCVKENSTVGNTANCMRFATRPNGGGVTERMRIASNGNVGIGTTNPLYLLDVTNGSGNAKFNLGRSNTATANNAYGSIFFSNSSGTIMSSVRAHCETDNNNAYLAFTTTNSGSNSECARFNKMGRLMLNSTTNPTTNADGLLNGETSSGMDGINIKHSHAGNCVNLWRANGDGELINFYRGDSSQGSGVGTISVNANSTSFNTSSDYRLKENITTLSDAITRLKNLKPLRFNFINNPTNTVDGFLAHEAQTVVPECATGTKDAVVTQAMVDSGAYTSKKLGTPLYQGLDYGRITPLLTAALQEAIAKIETLETEVAALKAA